MVLVDTSVWIEFFNTRSSKYAKLLAKMIEAEEDLCLTDIIVTEILQGIVSEREYRKLKELLTGFPIFSLKGLDSYIAAADIFRSCRKKGVNVRKTVDCLIAQVAIENDLVLLHKDRDFDQIAKVIHSLKILDV